MPCYASKVMPAGENELQKLVRLMHLCWKDLQVFLWCTTPVICKADVYFTPLITSETVLRLTFTLTGNKLDRITNYCTGAPSRIWYYPGSAGKQSGTNVSPQIVREENMINQEDLRLKQFCFGCKIHLCPSSCYSIGICCMFFI